MALVKNNLIVTDQWVFAEDDQPLGEGDVVVSVARLQAERETLLARAGNLGIILQSHENPADLADDIHNFQLICLNYPAFTDGRAYSYARLIRERYDYKGELRAVGNVLRDQLLFMHRCGFDAFDVKANDDKALQLWLDAQSEMTTFYQPTADGRQTVMSLRQRRRSART